MHMNMHNTRPSVSKRPAACRNLQLTKSAMEAERRSANSLPVARPASGSSSLGEQMDRKIEWFLNPSEEKKSKTHEKKEKKKEKKKRMEKELKLVQILNDLKKEVHSLKMRQLGLQCWEEQLGTLKLKVNTQYNLCQLQYNFLSKKIEATLPGAPPTPMDLMLQGELQKDMTRLQLMLYEKVPPTGYR